MLEDSRTVRWALAIGLAALVGCSGTTNKVADDGGVQADAKVDPTAEPKTLEACDDCVDFVVDRIVLPTTVELVAELSRDIDGDGELDNAIGNLVAQVLQIYGDYEVQTELDSSANEGDLLAVLRLTADGGELKQGDLSGQLWVAQGEKCCESDDPSECAAEARNSCFSGSYTFEPDPDKASPLASGKISGDALRLAGENISFKTKIFGEPTTFEIRDSVIEGQLTSDGRIVEGRISGVIDKSEVSRTIVVQLVNWINEELRDEDLDESIKEAVLSVLDENGNEVVDISEVTDGDLLGQIFSGDVDTDNDGNKEISVAFGFTAVPAQLSFK